MTLALAASALAVLGLLLLAMAGPAYRVGLLSLANAMVVLQWAAYAGLAVMAMGAVAALLAFRRRKVLRFLVAAAALAGGVTAFTIPFEWQRRADRSPPIHDISTDLENPPTFEAIIPLRADAPNSLERPPNLAAQQREGYPDIAPITVPVPLDQAFRRALAAAQESGWEIVTADQGSGRIEATDITRWFGFTDDIVVRLTPWGAGTRIDVRSVSRERQGDAGANARRIRRYLERLE